METKGPYRDTVASNAEALEKMEKEINSEGKFSIRLPESLKIGNTVPFFEEAIKNKMDPKKIVFYSLATGILKYTNHDVDQWTKKIAYKYHSPSNQFIVLIVELPKRKSHPAIVLGLSTKADFEEREKQFIEERKQNLTNQMNGYEKKIQDIKKIIEKGILLAGDPLTKELEKTYFEKLQEIKTSLKSFLSTINDKLEVTEDKNTDDKK